MQAIYTFPSSLKSNSIILEVDTVNRWTEINYM